MSDGQPATQTPDTSVRPAVLVNRRETVSRRGNGLATTIPVLVLGLLAIAALVILPLGRSKLTGALAVGLAVPAAVVALAATLFETKSRSGKMLRASLLLGALAFALLFPIGRSNSTMIDLGLFAVFAIAVMGLNLIQGFAGKVSLAHAAFMGIGAYTSALLDAGLPIVWGPFKGTLPNLPYLLTIPIAAIVTFLLSVLIGFPALRVNGPWLAFVTVAFNGLVVLVMINQPGLTNGTQGLRPVRSDMKIFGIEMLDNRNYYYFCLGVMLAVAALMWWIVRSPWGRSFKAIRDNAGRASSLGVSVPTYTLLAFAIGSSLAGIAGALYGPLVEAFNPDSFAISKSFSFLLGTVIGGIGTLIGPFFGTAFITFLENHLRFLGEYYQVAFAVFVIVMMLVSPKGVVGLSQRIRRYVSERWARR